MVGNHAVIVVGGGHQNRGKVRRVRDVVRGRDLDQPLEIRFVVGTAEIRGPCVSDTKKINLKPWIKRGYFRFYRFFGN